MRYFDLIGQSLIILLFGGMAVLLTIQDEGPMIAILYGAFFLGIWQMVSSFIFLVVRMPFFRLRAIHFMAAIFSLVSMSLVARQGNAGLMVTIVIIGMPVLLAGFYYYITWRWVLIRKRTGKFLPNVFI